MKILLLGLALFLPQGLSFAPSAVSSRPVAFARARHQRSPFYVTKPSMSEYPPTPPTSPGPEVWPKTYPERHPGDVREPKPWPDRSPPPQAPTGRPQAPPGIDPTPGKDPGPEHWRKRCSSKL